MSVLVVEDEEGIARFIQEGLKEEGYDSETASTAETALGLVKQKEYDLIVLDIMLPGMDGIHLCSHLRKIGINIPILILTARNSVTDKVTGLDAGADDYLTKPFAFEEFLARIRALLRKVGGLKSTELTVDDLLLDIAGQRVFAGKKEVTLSRREFSLLEYLARNADRVVSRSVIADHVWHMDAGSFTNVIDVFINHLRKKFEGTSVHRMIKTVRGRGYMLESSATPGSKSLGSGA